MVQSQISYLMHVPSFSCFSRVFHYRSVKWCGKRNRGSEWGGGGGAKRKASTVYLTHLLLWLCYILLYFAQLHNALYLQSKLTSVLFSQATEARK